jgi:hypothetical protein
MPRLQDALRNTFWKCCPAGRGREGGGLTVVPVRLLVAQAERQLLAAARGTSCRRGAHRAPAGRQADGCEGGVSGGVDGGGRGAVGSGHHGPAVAQPGEHAAAAERPWTCAAHALQAASGSSPVLQMMSHSMPAREQHSPWKSNPKARGAIPQLSMAAGWSAAVMIVALQRRRHAHIRLLSVAVVVTRHAHRWWCA